jgi:hypothetical protein
MKTKVWILILMFLTIAQVTAAQTNINLSNQMSFDGEPYIAVNPANQNNLIAGWMRLRGDGKIWIATKASFDKGQTWSAINFMPHDNPLNASADVSIAFHNSGVAYLAWINFRQAPDTTGAVFLSKSLDGGLTWQSPNKVISTADLPDHPFDRPWVAVDNSGGVNDGAIFVTSMTAYWMAGQHHIYLRTSTDGGLTWSTIKQVDTPTFSVGALKASYGGISIGKDGRAYIAFISYDVSASPFVRYYSITTTDRGASFQRSVIGTASVSSGSGFTKAWSLDANPTINGNAILTWVDNRNGDYDILLSKTIDGGLSWSTPIRVNDDPLSNGIEQDMVWADFSPSGKLSVGWRYRRLNGTGVNAPFDIYAAVSANAASTFSSNFRVTSVASPYFLLEQGNSFIGCAMSDSDLYLNWGDYRNSPDWDIYFNKIDLSNVITSAKDTLTVAKPFIELFPNPAKQSIQVSFSLPHDHPTSEIIIFNSVGQTMKTVAVSANHSGEYLQQIGISELTSGIYYLFVRSNNSYYGNITFVKE